MEDNLIPEYDSPELTEPEKRLLAGLRKNPLMAGEICNLIQEFEEEIANGMNADEAEEKLVNAIQKLGNTMMQQWAHNTQDKALEQVSEQSPGAISHSKKNSSGLPR